MTKEQETMVENNMALVTHIVTKFKDVAEFDDLFQVGCIGLIKAVRAFDASKGFAFSTLAVTTIKNEILMYLRREKNRIKTSSLNRIISDENMYEIGDLIESDFSLDDEIVCRELLERLNTELSKLNTRDRKIVIWHIEGRGQYYIAKQIGVSQSCVSRIISGFRANLKEEIC